MSVSEVEVVDADDQGFVGETADGMVLIERGKIELGRYFSMSRTGLTLRGKPTLEVCADMCEFLRVAEGGIAWALGDFMNQVEALHGEESSQILDAAALSPSTVRVYRWVASKVPLSVRKDELSFAHHQLVAEMEPREQDKWLKAAIKGDGELRPWSSARLRKELLASKNESEETKVKYYVTVEVDDPDKQAEIQRQLGNLGYNRVRVHN